MTAPDPVEVTIANQCWGVGGPAPAGAPSEAPSDAIVLYQGAVQAKNGFASWWAWDLRSVILKMAWDLLRFQTPTPPPADTTIPLGLRDSVNATLFLAQQNNAILKAIAAKTGTDITAITGE